jgi:hypothetical protein
MPTSRRRPPLPWRTSTDPARGSRSCSVSVSSSWMRSPVRQHDQGSQAGDVGAAARLADSRHDFLDRGRIGRIAQPLVARRAPGEIAGQGGRRPTAAGGIKRRRHGHGPSPVDDWLAFELHEPGRRSGHRSRHRPAPGRPQKEQRMMTSPETSAAVARWATSSRRATQRLSSGSRRGNSLLPSSALRSTPMSRATSSGRRLALATASERTSDAALHEP